MHTDSLSVKHASTFGVGAFKIPLNVYEAWSDINTRLSDKQLTSTRLHSPCLNQMVIPLYIQSNRI